MISYAASLACFGSYMTPELSAAFRQAKIRNVEVSLEIFANDNQYTRESRENTLELIRQKVIRPVSAHLPFGGVWDISALNDERRRCAVSLIKALLRENRELTAPNITIHASAEPPMEEHAVRIDHVCRSLEELTPLADELDLSFNVEYLPRTCVGHSAAELQTIVSRFDSKHVNICLDVNHGMNRADELPDIIRMLSSRIRTFHICDYDNVDELHWLAGLGCIDWIKVMAAIREIPHDVCLMHEVTLVHKTWSHSIDPAWELRQLAAVSYFLENCEKIMPEVRNFEVPGNQF